MWFVKEICRQSVESDNWFFLVFIIKIEEEEIELKKELFSFLLEVRGNRECF